MTQGGGEFYSYDPAVFKDQYANAGKWKMAIPHGKVVSLNGIKFTSNGNIMLSQLPFYQTIFGKLWKAAAESYWGKAINVNASGTGNCGTGRCN